ncbi:xanthine phosphoribosyltransferase [Clostridium tarantellae]|uniref:Xanthine phosphoribosyltransferase n=1 Tax=Clostridium tarantellae TaxID=39493 RepID=A0A6I1MNF7_9CLOT|nr:xanthine phosphoribosyltransferase [Clostridium tarantellae]MPQ43792.1 xanthine phosphoribosyltransferase [Clostridium tarantellae]
MELLKKTIKEKGRVTEDNILKVDSFLNHQMDVKFFNEAGKEFSDRFKDEKIDKILTIESTGIALGIITAQYINDIPVVFAKKLERVGKNTDIYKSEVYSFTKQSIYNVIVDKKFIKPGERILILDDFLANACAVFGLIDVVKQAGAEVVGVGIVIEKGFQSGRKHLEDKGIRVESLVTIDKIEDGKVHFR